MLPTLAELLVGLAAALAAGIVDVAIAMLQKPRGFETLGAMPPPILAAAALLLALFVAIGAMTRPLAARLGLDRRAAAFALATLLLTAFTLSMLAGLQVLEVSPHSLFRTGIVLAVSAVTSAGIYHAFRAAARLGLGDRAEALLLALPALLAQVVLVEWVEVYSIDSATSLASLLLVFCLIAAGLTTFVLVARRNGRALAVRTLASLVVLLAGAPLVGAVYSSRPSTVEARPQQPSGAPSRIIVLTMDTLRADGISAYSRGAGPTPAINGIAADVLLFEHAIAPSPWTLPSLTSVMTGLLPAAHLATGFTSSLSSNVTTLAEHLSGRGYYTAAIVHNDLLNPKNNLWQGFHEYLPLNEQWYANAVGARLLTAVAPATFPPPSWPSGEDQTKVVTDWLENHREENFFLWVHYFDPHAPYAPPAKYIAGDPPTDIGGSFEGQKLSLQGLFVPSAKERGWIRSLYDAEIRYVDENIGRVIATLKRLDLYEDSLIVFTSDHGEEFWEHGNLGHGHTMYGELLRVPLIMKLPGATARGSSTAVVSTASVTPTILDLAAIRYGADDMGVPSLLPLIDPARGAYANPPVVSGAQILFDRREAVHFEGFKYIVSRVDGREELYDLRADPNEQHSLAASLPERVETGRHLLQEQTARAAALRRRLRVEEGVIPADEDTVRRLRSLGYLR
jgi:arylsulfatase A-like enzyme